VRDRGRLAGDELGGTQLAQHLLPPVAARLGQRPAQVGGGRGRRARRERCCRRRTQCVDGPRRTDGIGAQQMLSHALGRGTVAREQARGPPVQVGPLRGCEIGVDRRAQDRVREAERVGVGEHLGSREAGRDGCRVPFVESRQRGDVAQLGIVAQYRERTRERDGRFGLPRDACEHRMGHGLGSELHDPRRGL
jgi:hypothetical protein